MEDENLESNVSRQHEDEEDDRSSDENQEDEEEEEVDEDTRNEIRNELKQMSLGEIQRLKNKLGLKAFNASLKSTKKSKMKGVVKPVLKRENKNRPREMSSKRQVGRFRDVVGVTSQVNRSSAVHQKRDPRFDAACGDFDEKIFKQSYGFVDGIKAKEREQLAKQLKRERNEERRQQLQYLIQRYDNQEREKKRLARRRELEREHESNNLELLKQGQRPLGKEKLRERELAEHFEELKGKKGALDKYLKRKNKKEAAKERKALEKGF